MGHTAHKRDCFKTGAPYGIHTGCYGLHVGPLSPIYMVCWWATDMVTWSPHGSDSVGKWAITWLNVIFRNKLESLYSLLSPEYDHWCANNDSLMHYIDISQRPNLMPMPFICALVVLSRYSCGPYCSQSGIDSRQIRPVGSIRAFMVCTWATLHVHMVCRWATGMVPIWV